MDKIDFKQIKCLEGLLDSLKIARSRKRKSLTLHFDEFEASINALRPAIALLDAKRLDQIEKAAA